MYNSVTKRKLKFTTNEFASCGDAFVLLNVKNSGLLAFCISDMPLNPRIHPVKEVSVFPVYVIISLSIFKRPYFSGKPVVWFTLITLS